jgi:hypothetical protein
MLGACVLQAMPNQPRPEGVSTTIEGCVSRYLMDTNGFVDGFLLQSGEQIQLSPDMGLAIVTAIHPCDCVMATVKAYTPSAYGQLYRAIGVTALVSGGGVFETQVERRPIARVLPPQSLEASGRIAHWLVDEAGEVSGFILTDGAQVHVDPDIREEVVAHIGSHSDQLLVMGRGVAGTFGVTIELGALWVNRQPIPMANAARDHTSMLRAPEVDFACARLSAPAWASTCRTCSVGVGRERNVEHNNPVALRRGLTRSQASDTRAIKARAEVAIPGRDRRSPVLRQRTDGCSDHRRHEWHLG